MHSKLSPRQTILYLNYIYLDNRIILLIGDTIGFEGFLEKSRLELDFLNDKTYEKIFNSKSLESFKSYHEKVTKFGYDYVTIVDKDYPHNLRYIEDRPALLFYKGSLDLSLIHI